MSDNLSNRGPADDSRVNVNQAHEVSYWTRKWNISEAVLKKAVSEAGVMKVNVEAWLRKNGHIR